MAWNKKDIREYDRTIGDGHVAGGNNAKIDHATKTKSQVAAIKAKMGGKKKGDDSKVRHFGSAQEFLKFASKK